MVLYISLLAPSLITLIAGLVIHSFIIAVNVSDWFRGRSVTPVDQIITSLVISRMCAQCFATFSLFVAKLIQINAYSLITLIIMGAVYSFSVYANVWLTSLLSIVFCLKISTLRTRLFLYLRRKIEQRTAYFIAASGLFSTIHYFSSFLPSINKVARSRTYNTTMDIILRDCTFISAFCSHTIGTFIPFLFFSVSSVLLFTSLYHHTRRMKMNGNLSINLKTYYSAMMFVSVTFIYNTIYFTGLFVSLFYYYLHCENLVWLDIFVGFLPSLHSSYLIYRTAKLRSHMSKVLQNVIDFLFQRKDQETREEIEVVV